MLSFLIPAYDCEDVIDEAVDSALSQALDAAAEVVIVDDGSSDSTAERLRAWQTRVPDRVRVSFHERNRGGAAARNTAARLATGSLLYMLDADNVLPEGCVASQLALMRATALDAISVGQLHIFEGSVDNVIDGWVLRHLNGRSTVRHLFETLKVPAAHGNYLYTRRLFEAAEGYSEDAGAMDAWTFGLKHTARGFEVGIDKDSYYLHRVNRPDRESYWSREQRLGTNDANAIRALRREIEKLPPDLVELVSDLGAKDRFFALVALGAFRSGPARFGAVRRRERVKHRSLQAIQRLTGIAARIQLSVHTRTH